MLFISTGYAIHAIRLLDKRIDWFGVNWLRHLKVGLGIFTISRVGFSFFTRSYCGNQCDCAAATCFISSDNPVRLVSKSVSVAGGLTLFPAYMFHHTQKLIVKAESTPIDAPFDPINE